MSQQHKLSLSTAILINLNIMIGVGVFINTIPLSKIAGLLSAFSYLTIGLLMIPLILSISHLLTLHPSGGFYTFARQEVSPFLGFMSTWSYFVAKLASTAIMTHVSVRFMQELIPALAPYPPVMLDCICIGLFTILNMQHIKTSGMLQSIFTGLKLFPLFFLIVTGIFLCNISTISATCLAWDTIPATLPLVLFSILGFEAACSLSSSIEHAEKNAARAVLISYTVAIILYIAYQLIVYLAIGPDIILLPDYRAVFPAFLQKLFGVDTYLYRTAISIFHCALASSALSAAYSIMFSNMWNLHILARHNHVFGASWLSQLNRHHIPWVCVIVEAIIALLHLWVTGASQVPLQVTSALGSTIAYLVSALSLFVAAIKRPTQIHWLIPLLALGSCSLLLSSCIYTLYNVGLQALTSFGSLLIIGIGMYWYTRK